MRVVRQPDSGSSEDGSVTTRQCAELTLPRAELERVWKPENLERLAATYWRYLGQISLGLLRVVYTPSSRELVVLGRPFVLLSFEAPRYELGDYDASVTYELSGGLLVAPAQRAGQGHLRISVERLGGEHEDHGEVTVTSEVASFYPILAGWGRFSRLGRKLYRTTQLRIHVIVTHAFLRSLARLDLVRSRVGALAPTDANAEQPAAVSPPARR